MAVDKYGNPIVKAKIGNNTKADYSGMTQSLPALVKPLGVDVPYTAEQSATNTSKIANIPELNTVADVVNTDTSVQGLANPNSNTQGLLPTAVYKGAPTLGYADQAKVWSNSALGTNFTGSPESQFDTRGMYQDSEGNYYNKPQDAATINKSMEGLGTSGGMFDNAASFGKELFGSTTTDAKGVKTSTGLGGMEGLATAVPIATGLFGAYNDMQRNDMIQQQINMQNKENKRQVQKEEAFGRNMAASGLGTYSAGTEKVKRG